MMLHVLASANFSDRFLLAREQKTLKYMQCRVLEPRRSNYRVVTPRYGAAR
jgi:hypothetical protein